MDGHPIGTGWNLKRTYTRSMSNLLTPPGLVSHRDYAIPPLTEHIPDARVHPSMPNRLQSWIKTETGFCRLHLDETACGLGMPKEWNCWGPSPLNHGLLNQTTSLFIWEYLSETLSNDAPNRPLPPPPFQPATTPQTTQLPISSLEVPPFSWAPPNLSPGGSWHTMCRENLRLAAIQYSDPDKLIREGIHLLKVHRQNYTAKGPEPKALQLLWWEFPKEHGNELREGSKMNFLNTPQAGLQPNTPMDDDKRVVAGSFVDELLDLGITGLVPEGHPMLLNAPLFVIAKEG
jgi:hypothetical protein